MMIRKFYTLVLSLFLFTCLANAQSWPHGSGARSSFEGFGIDYSSDTDDSYSSSSAPTGSGIFGDNAFISTMAENDGGWGGSPSDPAPSVPIAESILGLLGLGGAYAWKLLRGKNRQDKKE
ncbi:MAG: hypothetical protein IAC54_01115 [Bacteroidetes bacterium]|uniref:Uncharacterized protein n=1 Tax=Candidatus Caccoplasma merdipullorum TaxID=2840718 RepID=A0A9D9E3X5_9BACT|nr:hypothetical protein [Candidatus Caccoplasma merdipullorum]